VAWIQNGVAPVRALVMDTELSFEVSVSSYRGQPRHSSPQSYSRQEAEQLVGTQLQRVMLLTEASK
jgi:hypothetical protein